MTRPKIFRLAVAVMGLLLPSTASAYRPFEQTDADVVGPHLVEVELGPVALQRAGRDFLLVAPSLVVNYGVAPRFELVLEGRNEVWLRTGQSRKVNPQDLAVSIKTLAR